ncbi:MAG TPA: hypothetical protein PKD55_00060 [Bellilinea sp.]|nr:hypothetical protein [Bellilinea sp.]
MYEDREQNPVWFPWLGQISMRDLERQVDLLERYTNRGAMSPDELRLWDGLMNLLDHMIRIGNWGIPE